MRTTPKEGLHVSPAEMVFGEALSVPGEFFPSEPEPATRDHLANLRSTVGKYRPCIQTYQNTRSQHLPRTLQTCPYVFVRNDAHRTPLTRPYRGPYHVLERAEKAYRLSIDGRSDWISVDRLKPAYLEDDESAPLTVSRSGRPVRKPNRLSY